MGKRKNVLLMLNARKFLDVVAKYAASHDWRITLMNDGGVPQGWSGDGAMISFNRAITSTGDQLEYARKLVRKGVPVVGLSYTRPDVRMHRVIVDFAGIGQLDASYLHGQGYRSFAFVSPDKIPGAKIAYDAYVDSLRRLGHAGDVPWFVFSERIPAGRAHDWKIVGRALARFVGPLPKPLAVACMNDGAAISVLDASLEAGLSVPRDVGIVGSNDNAVFCENQQVSLSSQNPNHGQIAATACELLDRLMAGEEAPDEPVVVPPLGIFERESTGVPAVGNPLVARAIETMNEHLDGTYPLSRLAAGLGISPSKLNRAFHEAGLNTPAALLRELRIRRAKALLRTTDLTLGEIAGATGFAHAAHFLNVFRASTGETPSAWRDKWR